MFQRAAAMLAVVAVSTTAVACGGAAAVHSGGVTSAARPPTVVPSPAAVVASRQQPFTMPGVLACRASDLHVSVHASDPAQVGSGPHDQSWWVLNVRDVGSRPCFVGPSPDVAFVTASGPQTIPKATPWPGHIVYLATSANPTAPYFGSAVGEIDVDSCYLGPVDRLTVDFGPAQGRVAVSPGSAGGWGRPCPVAGVTYFTELYGLTNDVSRGMGYASRTQTVLHAPAAARAGERLHFQVTLENIPAPRFGNGMPASSTLTFTPCPVVRDEIEGVAGTFHSFGLDCGAAKPIRPGGSETWDMYIDVPAGALPGPATLVWTIDGSRAMYEEGTAYLPIT